MVLNFDKTLDLMSRSLDVNKLRERVIANNIANVETPNFKRSDITFETALKNALESENNTELEAKLTKPRHIAFHKEIDYKTVKPRKVNDIFSRVKNNGNNVDLEQENSKYISNQMSYMLSTTVVENMFKNINIVLR